MAKIGRSFDELDGRIKQCTANIKTTDNEIRKLDKDLKLNPGNVDAVRQKFALLSQNLQTNTQKLSALKEKQKSLTADFNSGAITQENYNRQLQKVQKSIVAVEKDTEKLTAALRGQNAAISQARFQQLTNGLDKVKTKADKVSKSLIAVGAAALMAFKSSIEYGDSLSDDATHYGTTAENLQIWSNRLGMLAKDQEAYTGSLDKVGSMLTAITAGRGARYLTYLKQLGLTQEDVSNKTNGEVFDLIYESLRKVNDETQRSIIAQGLLGDKGLEIAVIAKTAEESINELDAKLRENGIVTNEQAAAADEAANKLLELKESTAAANAELLVAAMPTIEAFIDLLKVMLLPVIGEISETLSGMTPEQQKLLLILLLMLIALPKIISFAKGIVSVMSLIKTATYGQAAAQTALTGATAPFLPVIIAISLALLLLITIIGKFIRKSKDATESANDMLAAISKLDYKAKELGGATEYSATSTYETNSSRELHIGVDVNATGDGTAIGQENAENVADALSNKILADIMNQELGGIVR